jgi:sugar lactone lactonase YvrE
MRQSLDEVDGWPVGRPQVFLDLTHTDLNPDGSVIDSEGCLWNAQWGASRVARYSCKAKLMSVHEVPAVQASCPAFGGDDLSTLFVTSAAIGQTGPSDGQTFHMQTRSRGQAEHAVVL